MARKKTHEEFVQEVIEKYGDKYEILEKYKGNKIKILIRHNKCNYEWKIEPSNLLQGKSCPKCAGNIKKTTEEFKKDVKNKYGDEYTVLGEYINAKTKVLVRHNCDGCNHHEYLVEASAFLRGNSCPICSKKRGAFRRTKTKEEFIKELNKVQKEGIYTILEEYSRCDIKIKVRHNKCGYEWKTRPSHLLRGCGCPVCSNPPKVVKLGINTIWDTDRWMCDLGVNEEDAKKYGKGSHKKITVKCPDCGRKKKISISDIYTRKSISCSCGDGKSYPEKFVFNLLEQLEVDFETEYKPKWIDNKRYDFYISKSNIIIEAHGCQHYNGSFKRIKSTKRKNRTLEEEQQNDKYKREVALSNGIKYYIELDCRESNLEWIKNSILNSELANLFDLNNINWNKCAEFANKNIVKEVCDYWNNRRDNETTSNMGEKFKLSKSTIQNYLKKGIKLGWCDYDAKEELRKSVSKNGKTKGKKVEIFKNNKSLGIFESCSEIERQSEKMFGVKLLHGGISTACKKEKSQYKGFTFKYIEEDNNLNINKIA
ncbi:hypothetical protein [Clostridium perfringens]|uniref:hypothetical protein n=1 Tax=Clostridium perfringens TaxID=1502 RepID=UPI0024BD1CC0|nr:hypothetical protein [Clostridium perfringens]